ncbi:hypothetical protein N8D74_17885 (plasmid) [Curtobacterium flaccumfaciens]|uniref:Uncharacterized protein n=1 Tax=Curtobacterium poinsettiae TaxID=159612 RepID=A0A9Q9T5C5_9MICO|nr:hypothetical protein [Curtobacterium flaccumfaciens]MCS6563627.1 hypothetical protein [Curtobacterium flaccumfaciens pv. poinsettiae]UXN27153.1 hypothetical protein N8D74_17885 [Curtobacterium flaccumfaciens]UXN30513.1 hypothetical protein N8D75_17455 [Curtobacterium flaccumfaciens]UYC82714.1 hypothetical protein OE229_17950 [Curtobacterium flaccumfaciens pv. poinsettiae]WQM79246.1 hypothetical protein PCFP23_485 [Curtobacterium flaccumfaciens pv. poinsettiae]
MDPAEVRERQERALIAFVLRARRVRAHSLAEDLDALAKLQNPSFTVTVNAETRETTVRSEYPPEEQVESAAARIRPLLLNEEDAHCIKTMNALLYFARETGADADAIAALKKLREDWKVVASQKVSRSAYEVRVKQGEAPEEALADHELAYAWIYGDVVHADTDKRQGAHSFGVEERFHAAVPLVARVMVLTIRTLNTLEWLHGRRILPFLHDAFAEDVVVTRRVVVREGPVFVAPFVDGALPVLPALGAEAGSGWVEFADEFLPDQQ